MASLPPQMPTVTMFPALIPQHHRIQSLSGSKTRSQTARPEALSLSHDTTVDFTVQGRCRQGPLHCPGGKVVGFIQRQTDTPPNRLSISSFAECRPKTRDRDRNI